MVFGDCGPLVRPHQCEWYVIRLFLSHKRQIPNQTHHFQYFFRFSNPSGFNLLFKELEAKGKFDKFTRSLTFCEISVGLSQTLNAELSHLSFARAAQVRIRNQMGLDKKE
jgi:hypothetical protein